MAVNLFAQKIRLTALFAFFCLGVVCMHASSLAYAASPRLLKSGTSGSCTWKYERVGSDIVFTIEPTSGVEGTLGQPVAYDNGDNDLPPDFTPGFSWNHLEYCELTKCVVVKGKVKVRDLAAYMFYNFQEAQSFDLSGLDVTGVTNMEGMFEDCWALTNLDVCDWNVSNVTNMKGMFFGCSALTALDVCKWDVSNVTSMEQMFENCFALANLDVCKWNVSKVTNMDGMFRQCSALTALDVCKWNVSNVTSMKGMFFDCSALTTLDVSNWDVSNVINMEEMFANCSSLTSLDLDKWKGAHKVSVAKMLMGTSFLRRISLGTNFHVGDNAGFEDAGFHVGTNWMQVNLGKGGTEENLKGKVFRFPKALLDFHRDRTRRETDSEEYVRVELFDDSKEKKATTTQKPEDEKSESKKSSDNRPKPKEEPRDQPKPKEEPWDRPESEKSSSSWHKSKKSSDSSHESKKNQGNWREHDGKISYLKDGKKLTGWQQLSGAVRDSSSTAKSWFCFDERGIMLTGRHKLVGGNPNAQGKVEERWFCFDKKTGRQMRGWVKDEKDAWYYYSPEDGAGLAGGRYKVNGGKNGGKHWFCFNENGLQVRGWNSVGMWWYYYSPEDGAGLVGQHELEGGKNGGKHWFHFDEKTGAQIRGWKYIDYQNKWCYYSVEDGTMLKGQHELKGGDDSGKHWFYFDEVTGAELRNCWKEIPSQEKTCYYGSDGAMYKGWHLVNGENFYFDEETGARR